jgi:hypothetical protein
LKTNTERSFLESYPLFVGMISVFFVISSTFAKTPIEQAKLFANDGKAKDFFGYDIALSGDTLVVGADKVDDNVRGHNIGAAYVFVRAGKNWLQQAKLTASDGAENDQMGGKVAISGDTAIIGSIRNDNPSVGNDTGAAYVFVRSGKQWSQQAKLIANDASEGDSLGWSIAISGDFAVVGAPKDDDNGKDSGSVYLFKRDGNKWSQQAKIKASDGVAGDVFGISVALSGNTILVGADLNDEKALNAGAAYVFVRSDNNWIEQAKLTATDAGETDIFGVRVSLDGNTALISARRDDDEIKGIDSGSAYVFVRSGNKWSQQTKLTAPDAATDDRFARSVAIHGNVALIGAMFQDNKGKNSGSAYIFKRRGNDWKFDSQITATDGAAGDVFGWNVALSDSIVIVSANRDDDNGENSGAVYVFKISDD